MIVPGEPYVMPNYGRFPIAMARGEGSWIWDTEGKKYLDFCTGIAVCSLGHCHPKLVEAIQAQAAKLLHCSNLYHIPEQAQLAEFIVEKVMQTQGKVFFCNSGAEANDGLVKLARKFGHDVPAADGKPRHDVITMRNSFHGRTLGGIAATGQDKVKVGFDPLLPGFYHVPLNDIEALREAVTDRTAAILLEPLQGEGGINFADPAYLQAISDLCREKNLLLMLDEVQCGIGRLGTWNGWEAALEGSGIQIEPDAVSWAKGLGGGFPIGAFWAKDRAISPDQPDSKLCDVLGPGTHGSTFGGTPLASAASLAVLTEIYESGAIQHAAEMGQRIANRVSEWRSPLVRGLKGKGLMLGFDLDPDAFDAVEGFLASGQTPAIFVVNQAMAAGLLTVPAGPNVVRWLPPLNVSADEVEQAFEIFERVLADLD